jgi:integration host factor subunit beta
MHGREPAVPYRERSLTRGIGDDTLLRLAWPKKLFDEPPFRRTGGMTKAELVERVAEKINLTKKQTETIVNILLNSITEALSNGDKVELRGFGSFRIRERNPREGRNPKTGETVSIPAKKVPFFKAGKELREMVDDQ